MNNINWKVRVKNKWFWTTLIPLILLLIQQILGIFGIAIDVSVVQGQILAIVETVFLILGVLGVVVDMTTYGVGDSERAMGYEEPYRKSEEQ